jgi:hypothetical protein
MKFREDFAGKSFQAQQAQQTELQNMKLAREVERQDNFYCRKYWCRILLTERG